MCSFYYSVAAASYETLVQGFAEGVSGSVVSYKSHLRGTHKSLLIRAREGMNRIEWNTAAVPENVKGKYVNFVWNVGISSLLLGRDKVEFTVEADGRDIASFSSGAYDDWTLTFPEGVELSFKKVMSDVTTDCFGYMFLRLPVSMVPKQGGAMRMALKAEALGLESWAMVFETPVPDACLEAKAMPAVSKQDKSQLVRVRYSHFGAPTTATIRFDGKTMKREVNFGENSWMIPVEQVTETKLMPLEMSIAGTNRAVDVQVQPVRRWETNFVQLTHTDIGYTRPQAEILAEHIRFIDYVLDYCDATDNYPEEAKFRWTCEGTWAVQEFMKSRPQSQIDRFIRRVKEGRIELTAMYCNFDELPSEQVLASSLSPLARFRELGLSEIKVATMDDVNGVGWCFPEYFNDIGVRYLTMGVNTAKEQAPFDKPTFFWWLSPSGKRVLAFYGEHYMHGDELGLISRNFDEFETKLLDYLIQLDSIGYKPDIMACEFLGIGGDNSAPSMHASDIVRQWNEKYEWPKVRLSRHQDYLSKVEERYGNDLPQIRGAWPDRWTDGFGGGAMEMAAHRLTDASRLSTVSGLSVTRLLGQKMPQRLFEDLYDLDNALLFYAEHTCGADKSVSDPFVAGTMEQRMVKSSYAWEGFRRERVMREKALGFLNGFVPSSTRPSVTVYNMSSWNRTGLVNVYIDFTVLPQGRKFRIIDGDGNSIPAQMTISYHDGAYWTLSVKDVPAYGYKKYFVEVEDSPSEIPSVTCPAFDKISTPWYEVALDTATGTLKSIIDLQLGMNILDDTAKWQAGQVIHERLKERSLEPSVKLSFTRDIPKGMRFLKYVPGDVWDTYSFSAHTDAGMGDGDNLRIDFLMYKTIKRIDLNYSLMKQTDVSPEAVFVSFPFSLQNARPYFDVPTALVQAGKDQLPVTTYDWNTAQNMTLIRNQDAQIVLASPETPLIEVGNINTGRYRRTADFESNHIFSYVMNNYWTTNFNADQHGEFKWTYCITSMAGTKNSDAMKFALECRVPMLARSTTASPAGSDSSLSGSFLSPTSDNVVVMNMTPIQNEDAVLLQLREMNGKKTEIGFTLPSADLRIVPSNVLGETSATGDLVIGPYETRFFKITR